MCQKKKVCNKMSEEKKNYQSLVKRIEKLSTFGIIKKLSEFGINKSTFLVISFELMGD